MSNNLEKKLKVIIDTDVDFDDYLAISFLLKRPEIEVLGIVVTGSGAVHLTHGVENIKNLLWIFDDPAINNIPVVAGAKAPLLYSNMYPYDLRHNADLGFRDTLAKHSVSPNSQLQSAELLPWFEDVLNKTDEKIIILSIGGCTNLARVYQKMPDLMRAKIEKIVLMGGNILDDYLIKAGLPYKGANGNVQDCFDNKPMYLNDVAEWNIFVDPLAADIVLKSRIPITMVALNACQWVLLTQDFVDKLDYTNSKAAHFVYDILNSEYIKGGVGKYLYFWDPLAAMTVVYPEIVETTKLALTVNLEMNEENDHCGELVVLHATMDNLVDVAMKADPAKVYQLYLETINTPDHK